MTTIQAVPVSVVEYAVIYGMLVISMVPVIAISRTRDTPERLSLIHI